MLRLRALNNYYHNAMLDAEFTRTAKAITKALKKAVKDHGWKVEKLSVTRYVTFVAVSSDNSDYDPKNVHSLCANFDYEAHRALSPGGNRPDATRGQRLFTRPLAIVGTSVATTRKSLTQIPTEDEQAKPILPFTPL